jgi:hypothetical protein
MSRQARWLYQAMVVDEKVIIAISKQGKHFKHFL